MEASNLSMSDPTEPISLYENASGFSMYFEHVFSIVKSVNNSFPDSMIEVLHYASYKLYIVMVVNTNIKGSSLSGNTFFTII